MLIRLTFKENNNSNKTEINEIYLLESNIYEIGRFDFKNSEDNFKIICFICRLIQYKDLILISRILLLENKHLKL